MKHQDESITHGSQGTSRVFLFTIVAALALAAFTTALAPAASAHAGEDTFTVTAKESGCPGGKTFCFEATEGDLSNVSAGDNVKIFFENPSSNSQTHSFNVALESDADTTGHDTPSNARYAGTSDPVEISPGQNQTVRFQLPSGASGVYFWCGVGGHEQQGMWTLLSFDSGGGNGDGGSNGSPAPGLPALLAVAGLAAVLKLRN